MVTADYTFYRGAYGGRQIPEEAWSAVSMRADAFLDGITFGRIRAETVTDSVRMAACAVAEVYFVAQQTHVGIKSESVDGYSVTYTDGTPVQFSSTLLAAADLYLRHDDPLRYAGV